MANLPDRGRGPGHYGESPGAGAVEALPARCLMFGTTPSAKQVFRAENRWNPGWKQPGLEVGSGVAIEVRGQLT